MIKVHYSQKPFYVNATHIIQIADGVNNGSRLTMVNGAAYVVDEAPAIVADLIRALKS